MAKSRGRKFAELVAPTNGVFAAASIPTIALSKLASSTFSVNSESASLGGNVELDSNDITEHSSALYFTNARAQATLSVASNSGHGALAYDSSNGQFTFAGITTEAIQDVVGAMFSSNTETAVTVTYQDSDGTIDLVVDDTTKVPLAGGTMTGNLTLGDNVNAYFGASTDLRIYHDGTNSHIINSTGELRFTGSNFAIKSDSAKLYLGAGDDLKIYHDGSNSYIEDAGTGSLILKGGTISINGAFALPTSDGSANQILQTDGSGTVSWVTNSGGSSLWSSSGSDIYYTSGSVGIGTNSPSHSFHVLSTDNKGFLLDRNTGNEPANLNEFSSYYSLSIKNRASGTYLNFGGGSAGTKIQATDGAGSATAKYITLNPYGGYVGIGTGNTAPATPLHINSTADQKIVFSGSNDPYIRWQEGTTNKGYMQWNAAGYFELRNEEVSSYWTLGNAFSLTPTTDEAFVIQRSGDALRQHIKNTNTTGTYSYLQLSTVNSSSTQNSGYLIKNAAQNTGNSLGNNSLYLWNETNEVELIPAGTIAKRITVDTSGDLTVRGAGAAASSGIVGEVFSGYFGLRQIGQSKGSEYMILTRPSDHTYISANSGQNVIIRYGGNDSTNQLIIGNSSTGLSWRGNTIWTAENDGSGSGLDADTVDGLQSTDLARLGNVSSYFTGTPSSTNLVRFYNASGQSMNTSTAYLSRLECFQPSIGADAFMTFHVSSDYAFYFGIDGATNDLSIGGWSMGANKYRVWHAGNDGATSGLFSQYTNTLVGTGGISNAVSTNHVEYSGQISTGTTGLFNASNNANGILRLNTHPGNYYHDLGFSSDGNMYHRNFTNSNAFTTAAWYKVWDESNDGAGSGLDADTLDGQHGSYYMASTGMATNLDTYVNLRVVRNSGSSAGSDGMYIGYGNAGNGDTRIYGGGSTSAYIAHTGGNLAFTNTTLGTVSMAGALTITNTSIRSNATSNWDGNPGAQGKIQYHSNRWYIVADQSSNRIVQFRRNGADVSYIDNSGNFVGNVTGTLGGISTANLVGAHNNSHSPSLEAEVGALHFYRNGANSGITNHPYALYQASGGWSTPYPDLNIAYHTGISLGGNNGYDGIRFFNDYTMATRILQVNGASNYIFKDVWMHTDPNEGMYSSGNGAHIYPNGGQSSYSPWTITGNRGGYGGIFCDYSDVNWMHDSGGNGGLYRAANSRWYNYHHVGNNCTGFSTSTTSSSYVIYAAGGIYATGNVVAYSDRRIKENIIPIDNALEKVNKLEGVYYNRIDDEKKTREIGFIAQDVNEVSPELVTYAEDVDQYGVKYGNTTALLVEAVKELTRQVNDLKKKLEEK